MPESPLIPEWFGRLFGYAPQVQPRRPLEERYESISQGSFLSPKEQRAEDMIAGKLQEYYGARARDLAPVNLKYPGFGFSGGVPLEDYGRLNWLDSIIAQQESLQDKIVGRHPRSVDRPDFERRAPGIIRGERLRYYPWPS